MSMMTKADYVIIKRAYTAWTKEHGKLTQRGLRTPTPIRGESSLEITNPVILPKQFLEKDYKLKIGLLNFYYVSYNFLHFLSQNQEYRSMLDGQCLIYRFNWYNEHHYRPVPIGWAQSPSETIFAMRCNASDLPD